MRLKKKEMEGSSSAIYKGCWNEAPGFGPGMAQLWLVRNELVENRFLSSFLSDFNIMQNFK